MSQISNFDLKVKIISSNNGIQYRSIDMVDVVYGYQADIDSTEKYQADLYEEGGRAYSRSGGNHRRTLFMFCRTYCKLRAGEVKAIECRAT